MDRNSAIGLTLIAALLMIYFYWLAPTPQPPVQQPATTDTTAVTQEPGREEIKETTPDSTLAASYGALAEYVTGKESFTTVETEDVKVTFTNRGGIIKELELRNFKTYYGEPVLLIEPSSTQFELLSNIDGKAVDLYDLFYQVSEQKKGDSTVVTFSLTTSDGGTLSHIYTIPPKGYQVEYSLAGSGTANILEGDQLRFNWTNIMRPTEKDLKETRNNSTITYYTTNDGFDELPERSVDPEQEVISEPVKWVAMKQKFFLSSIIANTSFSGGQLAIATNLSDTSVVKRANVSLSIPKESLAGGKAAFTYYLGPNDYQVLGKVTEDFAKNVYLGWPPVYWINKFIIFPVFHFLTLYIGNYGLIIIILVILLKLVLAPLSYRSYLSMAKMKVLKPDLDEIKEKNGDDMAKIQQEQLKLYQQVGVNPLSGCIPVLLQMPILFAMFYLFPNSIELRQESFLWAEDLSTYDSPIQLPFAIPFGVGDHISLFTLLMTISTLIYTWQNNQISSVQGPMKSMSYIMPLIFFFVLNSFPAGLTFYYFVSNLVTFAQQGIIRRFVDDDKIRKVLEENRKKNIATGGGKKSKFMAKIEEAMKASEEARRTSEEARKKKKK